ncbi:unnamed protein product [Rotaria magnacalcarata]|uniref:Uncharacterized protein n=1 Tax=Rotaria magnacalcarata TaxID=392030 RepID=A0A8S2LBI9_9BILA|nr:unnamed protein product [Rotaria magnacalcarata]CAF3979921.1 unnamed protein product [Rotaria magnacalcarata]CAF4009538.1 unnamed protein product [Rotaria magnacalcarata]
MTAYEKSENLKKKKHNLHDDFGQQLDQTIKCGAAWTPLRSTDENLHPTNTRWIQNGLIAVGGNGQGHGINQLDSPYGLYVDDDDDQTVYVADSSNHRIVKWKKGATNGQVVVGGNGKGSGAHQ